MENKNKPSVKTGDENLGNRTSEEDKRYDVVIIDDNTEEVVSTIGTNLTKRKADIREDTGWNRIDSVNFSIEVRESN